MSSVTKQRAATAPAPDETLAAWAKRCADQERFETRDQRGQQLLAAIARVLHWPPDRVTLVYAPRTHEAFAAVDSVNFRLIADDRGNHLLVAAGLEDWHQITSAAQLGELMRTGKLRGFQG